MNAPAHNLFEVVPLSRHIGAEIRGLDMSKPLDSWLNDSSAKLPMLTAGSAQPFCASWAAILRIANTGSSA